MLTKRIPLLLGLAFTLGLSTGCGDKNDTPAVDETTVTDPGYFFNRGVTTLKSPDSKTGDVNYQAAYDDFVKAANLDAGNKGVQYNAGWTAEQMGDLSKAETHYRKALELDPTYEAALNSLAKILAADGRDAEAVDAYTAYLAAKPGNIDMWNAKVDALTRAGQYDAAIAEAQAILQASPDNVPAYRNLSRAYHGKGELGMSQLTAEKAKSLKEGDPGIYNNMGVTYLQQGDQTAAIESFQTAIKVDPDNVEANLNLGYIALDSGDYNLALACFQAATGAEPNNVPALLGLAVAQRGTMDYEGASATYDKVLKLDPENEIAYFNAATLHEKYTKDFKKAKALLQAYVDVNQGNIAPSHEVFGRIDGIAAAEAEEKARQEELKRQEQERKEREERQKAQLVKLQERTTAYMAKVDQASCPAVMEMGMVEEFAMIGEQAQMVIDAGDYGMAGDMLTFLDSMEPTLDELIPMCGDAGSTEPAPAEGEATEAAPAEETAAEPAAEAAPTE
ncbi:MAG: tetratricopeptide repeat protein [Myxococcota bacterium]|nr:tetratricopeptide repeat protein [Myxococcota bacterium]